MSFLLTELFWAGVVPCVVAAAIMSACRYFAVRPSAAWAVSVGGALAIGQFGLAARISRPAAISLLFRPHEARDWWLWLVLVAAGIGVLAAFSPRSWQRWIAALACLFAAAVPIRLLAGSVYVTSRWSISEEFAVFAVWAALLLVLWLTLAAGRANGQPRIRAGLLIVVAVGMAITITLSGSLTTGELCGVVAAALTGALIAREILAATGSASGATGFASAVDGAAGVLAVGLGGLILLAHYYVLLPEYGAMHTTANTALLTAALVAAGGRLPTGWPHRPIAQAALRTALCLVPLAMALAMAYAATVVDPYAS